MAKKQVKAKTSQKKVTSKTSSSDSPTKESSKNQKKSAHKKNHKVPRTGIIDTYSYTVSDLLTKVTIKKIEGEYVPIYEVHQPQISPTTEAVLEEIRRDMIKIVDVSAVDITNPELTLETQLKFKEALFALIRRYFPRSTNEELNFLGAYLLQKSLGLGVIDTLMSDDFLEEIAVNGAHEPIWVYHRKWKWCKSTITLKDDKEVQKFASVMGRKVGRQINVLNPLLDANLQAGHRVNATLKPISNRGSTITLRRFSNKPWTITDMLMTKTLSVEVAAIIWEALHYELSILIAGGTASGKTSFLNAITNFFPPNQRILSIEDTREVQLPSFLHWVPMVTRQPNAEGKGEVSMLNLLVNSLRQRPDRILVGEIRRQKEAQVLFEAIHTGHSVYATVHSDSAEETITRLTSPPISVPKAMLPALDLIVVQYRNRRLGYRRTFQVAEVTKDGEAHLIAQHNARDDKLKSVGKPSQIIKTLQLFTGSSEAFIKKEIAEKEKILKHLLDNKINDLEEVGKVIAEYYSRQ